ncbi:MAG TPA: hypothetical protein PLQ76_07820 [bacterium]|nr:hypothetical protein [bacterium]
MRRLNAVTVLIATVLFTGIAFVSAHAAESTPPEMLLASLYKRAESLSNYSFTFDYKEYIEKDKKYSERTCMFWYVKPDLIKMNVTAGDDKGSKVAYNGIKKKNQVKAKASYMPIPITVKKTDPRLEGFFLSDWKSDAVSIKKLIGDGKPVAGKDAKIKGKNAKSIEFKGLKGEFDRIILWIGVEDPVLLQYEYYKASKLIQKKTWYDINTSAGLTEEDFKI